MKILFFIYSLDSGGAEKVVSCLANNLARRGHQVCLATYDDGADPFFTIDHAVELLRLKLSGGPVVQRIGNHFKRIPAFRRLMKAISPDVVVSFIDRTNIMVLLASLGCDFPVVVSERIDPGKTSPGFPYGLLRPLLYRFAAKLVLQHEGQVARFKNMSEKIEIIPNPVEIGRGASRSRDETVISAGRLVAQKNFPMLIEAFARISGGFPQWRLKIYGKGKEESNLGRLIVSLGMEERISLEGVTANLRSKLETAGCFVLASSFEGFPNVVLEALASGCPVIATDCSQSIRQLIDHGVNGLIVPPGDRGSLARAMKKLMADRGLRDRFQNNGPGSIERFHVDSVTDRWEGLLTSLSRQGRQSPAR